MSASMDMESLLAGLAGSPVPWTVETHPELPSTNTLALARSRPWHVVVTDHQTHGRGRLQRLWRTPPGTALTMSVTVPVGPGTGWLPLAAGVAVSRALEEHAGLATRLKWPNDVVVPGDGDRKVCGILCEVAPAAGSGSPLAVVGIGVNVRQSPEQLPTEQATSVVLAGGRPAGREALTVGILTALGVLHAGLMAGGERAAAVRQAYRDRCATISVDVRVQRPGGPDVLGTAVAVDDEGCLVVREPTGQRSWAAGDVTHLRSPGPEGAAVGTIPS